MDKSQNVQQKPVANAGNQSTATPPGNVGSPQTSVSNQSAGQSVSEVQPPQPPTAVKPETVKTPKKATIQDISSIITKPPREEKPKKLIWVVIFVLILIILGASGYLIYNNTKDPEVDQDILTPPLSLPTSEPVPTQVIDSSEAWKTYAGNGFFIDYPSEDLFAASTFGSVETLVYAEDLETEESLTLVVSSEPTEINTLAEIILVDGESGLTVTFGDADAVKIVSEASPEIINYYLIDNGKLFTLIVESVFDADLLDQVLDTFRFIKEGEVVGCSLLDLESPNLAFIKSYCLGVSCTDKTTQEECEAVDVVTVSSESGRLMEESQADGVGDCVWEEQAGGFGSKCQVGY